MQDKINDFLKSFGIPLKYSDEIKGPNTLKIYLKPYKYFKLSKIYGLNKELELLFNKSIVISQENNFIVLELNLADEERCFDTLEKNNYIKDKINLPIILGQDNNYNNIILNLKDAPHAIIAGTTGSGKSVLLRNIIKQLKINSKVNFIDRQNKYPRRG